MKAAPFLKYSCSSAQCSQSTVRHSPRGCGSKYLLTVIWQCDSDFCPTVQRKCCCAAALTGDRYTGVFQFLSIGSAGFTKSRLKRGSRPCFCKRPHHAVELHCHMVTFVWRLIGVRHNGVGLFIVAANDWAIDNETLKVLGRMRGGNRSVDSAQLI